MEQRHWPPTGSIGPPSPGRWMGPPVDLFPSRMHNNNNNINNNHLEAPQIGTIHTPGGPPVGSMHAGPYQTYASPAVPLQEAFRSTAARPAEFSPHNAQSWESVGPPMSSAPDRMQGPPRPGAPNPASESKTTREWVRRKN